MNERFDFGVFETYEFKTLEKFVLDTHTRMMTKLADNKVFDPQNMEFIYYSWLNIQGIRTGLKIWLNLIRFIRLFHKRRRFNKEFIASLQGVLQGLMLPFNWLHYRKQENKRTETTKGKEADNRVSPDLVAEALLKE